jgi:hypothetical protein
MTPAEIRRNVAISKADVWDSVDRAMVTRAMHVSRGELIRAVQAYDEHSGNMCDAIRAALEAIGFEVEPDPEPIPDELIAAAFATMESSGVASRTLAEKTVRAVLGAQAKLSAEQ